MQKINQKTWFLHSTQSLLMEAFLFCVRMSDTRWSHHHIPPVTMPAWNAPSPTFEILYLEL